MQVEEVTQRAAEALDQVLFKSGGNVVTVGAALAAVAVIFVAFVLAGFFSRWVTRAMERRGHDDDRSRVVLELEGPGRRVAAVDRHPGRALLVLPLFPKSLAMAIG